ncbi:MAG: tRNA (adenosine(37)-N6)-dimethylallyltransferase MiaA [Luminiphilus sp.]|nr:tRNA (adenosine(37)-N6)-dimethylallyltransferase MiaA [Luminiphilus sp.]
MGPTAAGKTDAAIDLAEALNGELISVDSALVYRGLSIGAAQSSFPHHLVDIREPSDIYNAADFVADASQVIDSVRSRGRRPILVGGTMLYFKALLEGLDDMPGTDLEIRASIEAEAEKQGWPALHAELERVDPKTAAQLHPNHSQRISRALEVYRQSGVPMSEWRQGSKAGGYDALCLALAPAHRATLHARIATRLDLMMSEGFIDEVAALRARGDLHTDLPSVRAVGYRQLWSYLEGEVSLDEALDRALAATRQLAKRQLNWLRGWSDLHWIDSSQKNANQTLHDSIQNYLGNRKS